MSLPPAPAPPPDAPMPHQARGARRTSRRAVLAAGAWTAPAIVVASTAPAFAASPCLTDSPYLLNWGSTPFTPITTGLAAYATVASPGVSSVYVHFGTTASTGSAIDTARNLTVSPNTGTGTTQDPVITDLGDLGGAAGGERGVRLQHNARAVGSATTNVQVLTISFRDSASAASPLRSVQGLTFSLTDIDSLTGANTYSDRISLSGSRTFAADTNVVANVAGGGTAIVSVLGTGTDTDPWRLSNSNVNIDENSAGARVRVTYPGPVTSITLKYWSGTAANIYHRMFLSDFSFTARPSGC